MSDRGETPKYSDEEARKFTDYRTKLKGLATVFSERERLNLTPLEEFVVVSGERIEDGDEKYRRDLSYRFRFLDVMPVLSREGSSTDKDALTAVSISKNGTIVELAFAPRKGGGLLATGVLIATVGVLPGLVMSKFMVGRDSVNMKNLTNLHKEDLELLNELGAESLDFGLNDAETTHLGSAQGEEFRYTTMEVVMLRKPGQKGKNPILYDDKKYVVWKKVGQDAFIGVLPTDFVMASDFKLVQDGASYDSGELYGTLLNTTDLAIKSTTQARG